MEWRDMQMDGMSLNRERELDTGAIVYYEV